jgi:hypothetical protein
VNGQSPGRDHAPEGVHLPIARVSLRSIVPSTI